MIPKLCGADVELGNFVTGIERPEGSGAQASRVLLRALAARTGAVPAEGGQSWVRVAGGRDRRRRSPQETSRVFLPANGASVYIDLDHLELCLPEVRSAHDHVAAWHAMLRLAQDALVRVNAERAPGRRIQVLVNNSDGWGNSYGGHLNVLITRSAWDGLMRRRLHHLAFLASYQASAVVFTGQGKVGSENDRPGARYQLSQRADFIETLLGPQTTFFRPLVNTRDEPHSDHARLHLISFDTTLAEPACLLRIGVTQIILALIEAEQVDPSLALDDPVSALHRWSHDPWLEAFAPLASGSAITALDLQRRFLDRARHGAARGDLLSVVPRATEILDLWQATLDALARKDWGFLVRRLDWVAKLALLERARAAQPGLTWEGPELKVLDHLYAGLDPSEGLFWVGARAGLMESVVAPERIEHFLHDPPEDTRAWARAAMLREHGSSLIEQVDWDQIRYRLAGDTGTRVVLMPNPLAGAPPRTTRADNRSPALPRRMSPRRKAP
jgi:proteasome accessory factor A